MYTTIIFAHPWHGSYNKAVLDKVVEKLIYKKIEYNIIDLVKDGFNPAISEKDMALYNKGKSNDPLVAKYQDVINKSDELIFIFPIWWMTMPAIIKGFIDKVMLKNFAYEVTNIGLKGKLNDINRVLIFTTSESPTIYIRTFGGDSIKRIFIRNIIKKFNIDYVKWLNLGRTVSGERERRLKHLKRVYDIV